MIFSALLLDYHLRKTMMCHCLSGGEPCEEIIIQATVVSLRFKKWTVNCNVKCRFSTVLRVTTPKSHVVQESVLLSGICLNHKMNIGWFILMAVRGWGEEGG